MTGWNNGEASQPVWAGNGSGFQPSIARRHGFMQHCPILVWDVPLARNMFFTDSLPRGTLKRELQRISKTGLDRNSVHAYTISCGPIFRAASSLATDVYLGDGLPIVPLRRCAFARATSHSPLRGSWIVLFSRQGAMAQSYMAVCIRTCSISLEKMCNTQYLWGVWSTSIREVVKCRAVRELPPVGMAVSSQRNLKAFHIGVPWTRSNWKNRNLIPNSQRPFYLFCQMDTPLQGTVSLTCGRSSCMLRCFKELRD